MRPRHRWLRDGEIERCVNCLCYRAEIFRTRALKNGDAIGENTTVYRPATSSAWQLDRPRCVVFLGELRQVLGGDCEPKSGAK